MKSDAAKTGMQQVPHGSLFSAPGMTRGGMKKPLMGIVSSYNEIVPGHMNLDKIVDAVKLSVAMAGGTPVMFPIITTCNSIAVGCIGVKYSLVTRDLIADSTECVILTHQFDALVMVPNYGKNVSGLLMAVARINISMISASGGSMLAGYVKGHKTSLLSIFEAMGAYATDNISEEDVKGFEDKAYPTCGSCSGMYMTNSTNCLTEVLGMGLRGNDTIPAVHPERIKLAKHAGMKVMEIYEKNIRPRDITTRGAFVNTLTMDMVLGCFANNMLHPPVVARETGVELNVGIANEINAETPDLCHLAPAGPTYIEDLNEAGGIYAVMKEISKKEFLNLGYMTVTGRTMEESIEGYVNKDPEVIRPAENLYSQIDGTAILKSNPAPDSAVMRHSAVAPEILKHEGPVRVLDCEKDAIDAVKGSRVMAGGMVVIRYEGPKGGLGMRKILNLTSAIAGTGLGPIVALITDGRFSSASRDASIGHALSEVVVGGPIAPVEERDTTSIDIDDHKLNVLVSDEEMTTRKAR